MALFSRPSEWLYVEGTCHEVGHTWSSSCILANIDISFCVFYEGFKLYLPLYLISELIRHRSLRGLPRVLPQVLRSSVFLMSNVTTSLVFLCLLRKLIGRFYHYAAVFLPCLMGGACSIMLERKSRRPLLAGYVATIAIELLYSVLKQHKVVRGVAYGEVALFSAGMAVLMHKHMTGGGNDVVAAILRTLFSPRLPAKALNFLQPTPLNTRLSRIILVGVWAFAIGYLLQVMLGVMNQGTRLLKEKGRLKRTVFSSQSLKFAAFLSSLAAGYKLVNSVLYYLPLPRDLRLLLAGLVAGLSLLFYRSTSVSLYIAWKALEVVYSKGVEVGWLKYLPHGEVLIYAFSVAWLFHGWFFQSHNMRWAYWHFLRGITRGRLMLIDFEEVDKFGTEASTRIREWTQMQQQHRHSQHSQH